MELRQARKVVPLSNYRIEVTFVDDKKVIYDVSQDIRRIKGFHHLKDQAAFKKVYLQYNGYAIAWGDGDEFVDPTMDCEVPYDEGEEIV